MARHVCTPHTLYVVEAESFKTYNYRVQQLIEAFKREKDIVSYIYSWQAVEDKFEFILVREFTLDDGWEASVHPANPNDVLITYKVQDWEVPVVIETPVIEATIVAPVVETPAVEDIPPQETAPVIDPVVEAPVESVPESTPEVEVVPPEPTAPEVIV